MTKEDYNNVLIFLNRVQLTGQEAVTFVVLQQKIVQVRDSLEVKPTIDEETKTSTQD